MIGTTIVTIEPTIHGTRERFGAGGGGAGVSGDDDGGRSAHGFLPFRLGCADSVNAAAELIRERGRVARNRTN
jgi:hypothetical protein